MKNCKDSWVWKRVNSKVVAGVAYETISKNSNKYLRVVHTISNLPIGNLVFDRGKFDDKARFILECDCILNQFNWNRGLIGNQELLDEAIKVSREVEDLIDFDSKRGIYKLLA